MEQAELENFFDEPATGGERWIILSDMDQKLPQFVKVVSAEVRIDKSGKNLKVLLLESEGRKFVMSAWARDVEACVNEWGKNPMVWQRCEFVAKNGRWTLKPTTNNHTTTVI